jgi:uncharacterized Zn finger protein (UPF0148 family)
MDAEKYNRSVTLNCPSCGCDQFEYDDAGGLVEHMKCARCQREYTRDELIGANSENVSEHVKEMKEEIVKDVAKEFRTTLKKAFGGSKFIKFR